jgi:NAD(P)H-flavin reductase
MISDKQKQALEKITGDAWYFWNKDAVHAYFSFTEKGKWIELTGEAKADFETLIELHKEHPIFVESLKEDFTGALTNGAPTLFLWDFYELNSEKKLISVFPDAFLKHVFEIYKEAKGYIPVDEVSLTKEWAEHLGVKTEEEEKHED